LVENTINKKAFKLVVLLLKVSFVTCEVVIDAVVLIRE